MTPSTSIRVTRAREVVSRLSNRLGFVLEEPILIRDSRHVTLRVNADVVARVLLDADEGDHTILAREREVSHYLAEKGAPVTRPTTTPDTGPHRLDGHCVTFWCYQPIAASPPDVVEAARALAHVHGELREFPGKLPHFWRSMETAYESLQSPAGRQFLSAREHAFLVDVYGQLQHLRNLPKNVLRPLHGECHLGNVINSERGHLWLDFENVCEGPIEWDLSCLPVDVAGDRVLDADLFREMCILRSWATSVWCWLIYDRSEEKREAAEYHLAKLKRCYPDAAEKNRVR